MGSLHPYQHSLKLDAEKCDGCFTCMRACPTGAVRVRSGKALKLTDRCIDCGECGRSCPRSAVVRFAPESGDLSHFDYKVAVPSPVLYSQFDSDVLPGAIASALKKSGFDAVESLSPSCDTLAVATEMFVAGHEEEQPLISSFCPAVVQLVQVKYPELLSQMLPLLPPQEVAARDAKMRRSQETGIPEDRIGAAFITPCAAGLSSVAGHPGMKKSNLDAAIAIGDLYSTIGAALSSDPEPDTELDTGETASGISWAFRGGFPRPLPAEQVLFVSGLQNVNRILEDLKKGKLRKYAYVECHACSEGCVGGSLTSENPYSARRKLIRLWQKLPSGPAVERSEVERRYRQGDLTMDLPLTARQTERLDSDISRAIAKKKDKERVLGRLPGFNCGACGAPTCLDFAHDVAVGEAAEELCAFILHQEIRDRVEGLARLVKSGDTGGAA
jgi:Na+-translocating ferredoxin:NAD+ oxidoreductase RNF subunit RnfB